MRLPSRLAPHLRPAVRLRSPKEPYLYFWKNIKTQQTVFSRHPVLTNTRDILHSIPNRAGPKVLPHTMRKDLWSPFLRCEFPSRLAADRVYEDMLTVKRLRLSTRESKLRRRFRRRIRSNRRPASRQVAYNMDELGVTVCELAYVIQRNSAAYPHYKNRAPQKKLSAAEIEAFKSSDEYKEKIEKRNQLLNGLTRRERLRYFISERQQKIQEMLKSEPPAILENQNVNLLWRDMIERLYTHWKDAPVVHNEGLDNLIRLSTRIEDFPSTTKWLTPHAKLYKKSLPEHKIFHRAGILEKNRVRDFDSPGQYLKVSAKLRQLLLANLPDDKRKEIESGISLLIEKNNKRILAAERKKSAKTSKEEKFCTNL